jgi:hypothetical protein
MNSNGYNRRDFLRHSAVASAGLALGGCQPMMGGAGVPGPANVSLPDPNQRQGEYVEVNGARIFYQMTGQGEPMLLLHGYPLSGALFSRVRDELARRFRVITLDHRGYGMSRAPGVPDSIATYAQDGGRSRNGKIRR